MTNKNEVKQLQEQLNTYKRINDQLIEMLKQVTGYMPPDDWNPEGELRLNLSETMNERVLTTLRNSGL